MKIKVGNVKYVGRALLAVGLRSSILNQINAFGDGYWDKVNMGHSADVAVFLINAAKR